MPATDRLTRVTWSFRSLDSGRFPTPRWARSPLPEVGKTIAPAPPLGARVVRRRALVYFFILYTPYVKLKKKIIDFKGKKFVHGPPKIEKKWVP